MHVVAEAQRNGGICAYIDAEHAMDPVYASAIGVDIDQLLISQPDTGEQALEIVDMLVRSGAVDVVVIDSVAALTPRAEIEGEMGDTHVGLQARLMSQALRKLTANLSRTNTVAIFINQLREKIGVMFGSPEPTAGGRALKFYSSVRLDIRRIESIKDGAEIVGNRTRVKVVKNKVAPPFRQAEFDIMYGKGISREGTLLDIAVDMGIIKKSGAWFTYEGEQLGQGRENAKSFLTENPEIMVEVSEKVRVEAGIGTQDSPEVTPADEVPITIEERSCRFPPVSPWSPLVSPMWRGQHRSSRRWVGRSPAPRMTTCRSSNSVAWPCRCSGARRSPTMRRFRPKARGLPASRWRSTWSRLPRSIAWPPSGWRVVARWSSHRSTCSGAATPDTSPISTAICGSWRTTPALRSGPTVRCNSRTEHERHR